MHSSKTYDSILVTEEGIVTSSNAEHPSKAFLEIMVHDNGIITWVKDVQWQNVSSFIVVNDWGSVILLIRAFLKALLGISISGCSNKRFTKSDLPSFNA